MYKDRKKKRDGPGIYSSLNSVYTEHAEYHSNQLLTTIKNFSKLVERKIHT